MNLNYKTFGSGYPVIIVHGLFGMLDNWQTLAKKLAENYSVYIIDQRNHGRSPHATPFDYEVMADDLQAFMESQWIYEAHLVGHSMGGKTVMQFATKYPDLVNRLVVVDIAPKSYKGSHHLIFDALLSIDFDIIKSRKEAEAQLKKNIENFEIRQFLLKNLTRKKTGGYQWKMNLPVIYENYSKVLANIEVDSIVENPTLFIKGGKSEHILQEDMPNIKNIFPAATLENIEKAGHWVHADAPLETLALLKDFLDEA
jgi:pimeloyl-ACP methyl ester carboxylesterase